MKVDYDYLKALLKRFEDCEKPYPLVSEIAGDEIGIDNRFAFHICLLHDQGFLQCFTSDGRPPFEPSVGEEDDFDYIDLHMRLTAQGYDFITALNQKTVWSAIKGDLKGNSIETIWKVSQGIMTKVLSEKAQKYIDLEALNSGT